MTGVFVNSPSSFGTGNFAVADTDANAAAQQLSKLSTAMLEELQQKALQYMKSNTTQQGGNATPGVADANGAPEIDGVKISFSAEDLGDALRMLGTKTQDAQLKSAKESLETSKLKMAESHKKAIEKIEEYARQCAEAKHASIFKKIFGWIGKALALVGAAIATGLAAVATVATGGAAAPALAISAMCLAAATISMASAISQECGGPPLELSSLLTKAIGAALQACGVPKEKAESIGKIVSGVAAMALTSGAALLIDPQFATNVVAGSMELGGVDPDTIAKVSMAVTIATTVTVGVVAAVLSMGGSAAGSAANIAGKTATTASQVGSRAAGIAQGATQVASGAAGVGSGIAQIEESKATSGAENALADKKKIDAITMALMKAMEEDSEEMKKVIKQIEESLQSISDLIAGSAQSLSDITANLKGGRAAV